MQVVAPLNQVIGLSATGGRALFGRVDGNRLAVIGRSYGGGALLAGTNHPSLKAVIPLAWVKRFVDEDVRYSPYLCGAPHEADLRGDAISAYRENCPY